MNPNYHIMRDGTYVYHCRYCKKTFRDETGNDELDGDDERDQHEKTHKEYTEL